MDELVDKSIEKNSISLARNRPCALVVGAAGFLGSTITDKLLGKGIQVIGVDNLSTGSRQNLENASKERDFHLIIEDARKLSLDLPRLDYIVIATSSDWDSFSILKILKEKGARALLISSIDLYQEEPEGEEAKWLQKKESEIARFAKEHNLNARVLRLGPVFGPRMHFRGKDPVSKLIKEALSSDLKKDNSEFSTRALFIDDAIDLAIKSILVGGTAHRIFDGVLPSPIKIEEIKQILLDPLWYEARRFSAAELPPWPTPNLNKTIKFLNWQPKSDIVRSLRETLSYFKDHEIKVNIAEPVKIENAWKEEKREVLEGLKGKKEEPKKPPKVKKEWGINLPKFKLPLTRIYPQKSSAYFVLILSLIVYSLIWPFVSVGWGVLTFRYQLLEAVKNLERGEFEKSSFNLNQAEYGLNGANEIFESLEPLRKIEALSSFFEAGDGLSKLADYSLSSAKATILGVEDLYKGLKAVTGELTDPPKKYFDSSQVSLTSADEQISKAYALINKQGFKESLPFVLRERVESLEKRLSLYGSLVKNGRAISVVLPELIGQGNKNYLILLQNNSELRPTGGFIGSFAKVNFEGGKLKKLEVNDIYAIDGQLSLHVEPPKEIKEDLGQKDWFLRDSNWEPDFPTAARQAEWFYTKETGERVEGVLALDVSAIENLLEVLGPLNLTDYNESITSENLFERAVTHAELSFFPGSQNKKNFLTALSNQLFNKLFFLPNQNWPGIVGALGKSLETKHMSIYLDNPKLFSYLVSQNWTGALPRASKEITSTVQDFLAPVEANLGANKSNYYLDRSYKLETVIGKEGDIKHRLRIAYLNKSPSDTFPAGKYKNRMRIYLPFGAKMSRVIWGETEVKEVESFVDYGRSGFSYLIELGPKQSQTLVLDYEIPTKLEFKEDRATYRLDVIKQAGTLNDPFEWTMSYPISYKLVSNQADQLKPQEQVISTDLSKDRSFEVEFVK